MKGVVVGFGVLMAVVGTVRVEVLGSSAEGGLERRPGVSRGRAAKETDS